MSKDGRRRSDLSSVAAWDGLIERMNADRALRVNLIHQIVKSTRREWTRRRRNNAGAALLEQEAAALEAFEVRLREAFEALDEAGERLNLWSAAIEMGDRRNWGR